MDSLSIKAMLAGLFFGLWPILMNRSGLGGNVSSLVFTSMVLLIVAPFAIASIMGNGTSFSSVNWAIAVASAVAGAVGLLVFNSMLAKATPQAVGTLFVLMIVVQTMVPAIYQTLITGTLSLPRAAGFLMAIGAAFLLTRF